MENFDISQRAIGWKTNRCCRNFASFLPSIDNFFFDDCSSEFANNRSRASSSLSSRDTVRNVDILFIYFHS